MKRRFFLLILLFTWCISLASFFSILHFYDPYENQILAPLFLLLSFLGSFVSISSIVIYFCKKIYYRGDVDISNILASMRQSLFLWVIWVSYVLTLHFWIPSLIPLLWAVLFFLSFELLLQSFYYTS